MGSIGYLPDEECVTAKVAKGVITSELEYLESNIANLRLGILNLRDRLSIVSKPDVAAKNTGTTPEIACSKVGESIYSANKDISDLTEFVLNITSLLDI